MRMVQTRIGRVVVGLAWMATLSLVAIGELRAQVADAPANELAVALDHYFDTRFDGAANATRELVAKLERNKQKIGDVEALLRAGRASYPAPPIAPGTLVDGVPLANDYVDYDTTMSLFVPKEYDAAKAWPLVIVGHGGNAEMSQERAELTARDYIRCFTDAAAAKGVILAAPATGRGWMWTGNSLLLSAVSKLSRDLHIDPDRVYVTGHSMGGHFSWRAAIYFADRFGAVGPMSGGYDYVADRSILNLFNIPGYATHGRDEPYGIADHNRKMRAWLEEHRFDWVIVEKPGGHEIFEDEVPKLFDFFAAHPRDPYRPRVFARGGGSMRYEEAEPRKPSWPEHTWRKGRPIEFNHVHWVELIPAAAGTPAAALLQEAAAEWKPGNQIELTTKNVRKLALRLHPKMVDLAKPIELVVNGEKRKVSAKLSLATLLEHARRYDDRGRLYPARLEVTIATDREVPEPSGAVER